MELLSVLFGFVLCYVALLAFSKQEEHHPSEKSYLQAVQNQLNMITTKLNGLTDNLNATNEKLGLVRSEQENSIVMSGIDRLQELTDQINQAIENSTSLSLSDKESIRNLWASAVQSIIDELTSNAIGDGVDELKRAMWKKNATLIKATYDVNEILDALADENATASDIQLAIDDVTQKIFNDF